MYCNHYIPYVLTKFQAKLLCVQNTLYILLILFFGWCPLLRFVFLEGKYSCFIHFCTLACSVVLGREMAVSLLIPVCR